MEKTIKISESQSVTFKATASTLHRYRKQFGSDLLMDMDKVMKAFEEGITSGDQLETFLHMAFIMAKQADPDIPNDPDEWLDTFEVFPINVVLPEVVTLWKSSNVAIAEQKNV
jgi:hypothetical protein